MTVRSDVQTLLPMEVVEMFEWDATALGDTQVYRWHPGTTVAGAAITWQTKVYTPYPIQGDGFDLTMNDKLPRPRLQVANTNGLIGNYLRSMDGALGAKVTRKRTLGKYLDAVNFPGGNPSANAATYFPDEIFYVARKSNENAIFIELELATKWDVSGIMLPRRQVIAGICTWKYRSPECSYTGPNVPTDGKPDGCGKTLQDCKNHFGQNSVLRTSAFPASLLARQ